MPVSSADVLQTRDFSYMIRNEIILMDPGRRRGCVILRRQRPVPAPQTKGAATKAPEESVRMDQFSRTEMLIGPEGMDRLRRARVAVFGVGGVGGSAAEALVRCGVGALDVFDNDVVSVTNLNRQVIATHRTVGRLKVDVIRERLRDICPQARITAHPLFYLPENADTVDLSAFDYILDAVDTVSAKLELAVRAHALGVPLISAMGAGNRLDPSLLRLRDIYETENCHLARVMRRELRRRGIPALRVAYSLETARKPQESEEEAQARRLSGTSRRDTPGSVSFVPPAMGLLMASGAVRDLIRNPASC